MTSTPELSLILPVLNEAAFIERITLELLDVMDASGIDYEVLLAENGSTDDSLSIMLAMEQRHPRLRVVVAPHRGWGIAILTGHASARGEYLGHMPSDGQIAASVVPELFRRRGPRKIVKIKRVTRENLLPTVNSKGYNALARGMFGLHLSDTNGCPKIYPRALLPLLDLHSKDSFIDLELMVKAAHLGLDVEEVPTEGLDRVGGRSNTSLRTVAEFVRNMSRFRVGAELAEWKRNVPRP